MLLTGSIPKINIGILTEKQIVFELYGDFKIYGMKKNFSGRFKAELSGNRIICKGGKDTIESINELVFEPGDPAVDSFFIPNVTIGEHFHWQRIEKQRFMGAIKLLKSDDKIVVINTLPIEDYLLSVISSEMSSKSSLQLLKAHAVVSRSWTLAQLQIKENSSSNLNSGHQTINAEEIIKWSDRKQHTLFDVCADDHCQRYQGIRKITTTKAKQAIDESKGLVLISEGKVCDSRYSKCCGGITESFENVWEQIKYDYLSSVCDYKFEPENYNTDFTVEANSKKWIRGTPPAFCSTKDLSILNQILIDYDRETKDFYRWNVEYTQDEINELIKTKSGIDFGKIKDLIPIERGYSSRIIKLKIVGTQKTLIIGKELEIRRILSPSHLYSSAIYFEKKDVVDGIPQRFIIYGAGWGHGVGMCQIGAAVMASQGYQFDEILLHYFRNAKIQKIY